MVNQPLYLYCIFYATITAPYLTSVCFCAVPPSSMGDSIFSSLSAVFPIKVSKPVEQLNQTDPLQVLSEDTLSFVDDVAEIITVTDYAEVELVTSTEMEVVVEENCCEGTDTKTVAEDTHVVLHKASSSKKEEATQGNRKSVLTNHPQITKDNSMSLQQNVSLGPHDCPDCEKKFNFASSLIAHRVIHTGERPHRCSDCGRCFSFRQSLDRHRHTHKAGCKYDCVICGETFHSLSARTQHKQTHMEDGVYACSKCSKKFNWELALARHLKTHSSDNSADKPTEICKDGQEAAVTAEDISGGEDESSCQVQADDQYSESAEGQSCEHLVSEPTCPGSDHDLSTLGKVRKSGRKRRPTMKIQVINLQKRMTTKKKKDIIRETPPPLRPLHFTW